MVAQVVRVAISGSNRPVVPRATLIHKSNPHQKIKVSIYARINPRSHQRCSLEEINREVPERRKYLSDAEFNDVFGADPADLKRIAAWAEAAHLRVLESSVPKRRVMVEGAIADVNKAFGVELNEYSHPTFGHFRGREGEITVPAGLQEAVEGVFGLDTRHVGRSRRRRARFAPVKWRALNGRKAGRAKKAALNGALASPIPGAFFPIEVAALYDYPSALDGTGQNIAIFAFNGTGPDPRGGYKLPALKKYFEETLGGSMPSITDVVVHGPGNDPGPDTQQSSGQGDSTGEVMLDMCVVGSVAPAAKIFMYFTTFTSQGWVDALHDAIADKNKISIISISYGNPEDDPNGAWTTMGVKVVNAALQAAAAKGITILCASGDDGSSDGSADGKSHVDFPASSPFVLGVGGTRVESTKGSATSIASETVWNEMMKGEGAGGGGISALFNKPTYQDKVSVPPSANSPHQIGRGVPDVSAIADPETGVVVMHIDGLHLEAIGGTSASAPLWAALIARINQGLNARCGFLNPLLYTRCSQGVLRDITSGNNGAYEAEPGWDACTGLGSPNGDRLLNALS